MQQAIIIRVKPENYDLWYREHSGQEEARLAYGITDGPLYRDAEDPNVALVHLNVEDLPRAMGWFKSDPFRQATERAGKVSRELWIAEKAAPPSS